MAKTPKKTVNKAAEWLIEHRWRNSLHVGTKDMMPAFVEDAVMAACYIVAGTNNGKINVSPKLVFKCLMLPNISTDTVKRVEVGYEMSERHARRLAQTTRFALSGIINQVQQFESQYSEEDMFNWKLEKKFIQDYYNGIESSLYSHQLSKIPDSIFQLYRDGHVQKYLDVLRQRAQSKTVGV